MEIDQGVWLTYAQAGDRLGISADAARQLAKRRNWQRRIPNEHGALATVLVPLDVEVRPRGRVRSPVTGGQPGIVGATNGAQTPVDEGDNARAIAALVGQLVQERGFSARLEERAAELQASLVEVQVALADSRAAERIAAGEAAGLRAELDRRRREWRLLRRLRWALRPR